MKTTKVDQVMVPPIIKVCVTLCLLFVCLGLCSIEARALDYAVQIAALKSPQAADELTKGLRAQGINAYCVPKSISQAGLFYRVRVGKFASLDRAYVYAEQLMDSGIFATYAIAAYEAPKTPMAVDGREWRGEAPDVQAFAAPASAPVPRLAGIKSGFKLDSETIDMVASIGTRGWLLLSSREVLAAQQSGQGGQSALSRELARLAASVGSRGWTLNNNIAGMFTKPAPAPQPAPSVAEAARNPIPTRESAAPAIANAEPALRAAPAAAPEIGRKPLSPTRPNGTPMRAPSLGDLSPVKIQGAIEMRNGQMFMTLRNLDPERAFTGNARVMLTNERGQQDVPPMQIAIDPDKEESFPISDARIVDGDWMLMVYDQTGKARLVRGASLAPPRPPMPPPGAPGPGPGPGPGPNGPPSYVTGMFDATSSAWKLAESQTGSVEGGAAGNPNARSNNPANGGGMNGMTDNPSTAGIPGAGNAVSQGPATQNNGPVQVTVTPRQIAATAENVILEFDIAASRPLNYLVITLRCGEYQDTRQALMTTPQGRVPFLIPIANAGGPFAFELKDESGALLSSGSGDFRRLSR